jgi:hypothetical protein
MAGINRDEQQVKIKSPPHCGGLYYFLLYKKKKLISF